VNETLTVEAILGDPEQATKNVQVGDEAFVLRPLQADDVLRLTGYFEGLSEATRGFFAPHEFTGEVARALCEDLGGQNTLRIVAVTCGDEPRIVGYFILQLGLRPQEHARFGTHGMMLADETSCAVAPSVVDACQNVGLGSSMMRHVIDIARRTGRDRMILIGGVGKANARGVHFYEKFGFGKVGPDDPTSEKDDLVLSIDPDEE
jgi:ribosomal protein S18 acetylase RimI-like enzyme